MEENKIIQHVKHAIHNIRGKYVLLDFEVAEIYGVETKRLNEQVKRNKDKFPEDFHFQLNEEEFQNLKSQNATSSWGGRRTKPYAFTEHGVLQAANVAEAGRREEAGVLYRNSLLSDPGYFEYSEMRDILEDLYSKYKG